MKYYKKHKMLEEGYLNVDDLNKIYYGVYGNKEGIPVMFVHGGPGGGTGPRSLYFLNPKKYKIILFDQRGCGKSQPFLSNHNNDIFNLVSDMEKLRIKLNIDKLVLFGGSFGSTLSLAYAIKYPNNVSAMILRGIFLGRDEDVSWLYKDGAIQFFPDEFEKYLSILPDCDKSDPISGYYKLFNNKDVSEKIRNEAYQRFANLEGSIVKLKTPDLKIVENPKKEIIQIAYLENYFFYNKTFKDDDNYILNNIDKIKHIKTIIIHGRYDMVCRPIQAYLLNKALPNSKLYFVNLAGHSSSDKEMFELLMKVMNEFKI